MRSPRLGVAMCLVMLVLGPALARAQTGSCCVRASCTLRTFSACDSVGGDWNPGDCSPNPCAVPGRCCSLGNCTFTTDAACSGVWTAGGSCSTNPCPPPAGVCCANGLCTVVTQAACGGGAWTISGFCPPNPCPPPACELGSPDRFGGHFTAVLPVIGSALLVARGTVLELYNAANPSAPVPFFPPRRIQLESPAREIACTPGWTRAFVRLASGDVVSVTLSTTPTISEPRIIRGSAVDIEADLDRVHILDSDPSAVHPTSRVYIYTLDGGGPVQSGRVDPALEGFEFDRLTRIGSTLWMGLRSDDFDFYGVEGWNVGTPAAPAHIATSVQATTAGCSNIKSLGAVGHKLLVTFRVCSGVVNEDWLRVADVSTPAQPVWHPAVDLDGDVVTAATTGNHLRLTLSDRGVATYDTTNPASPALLGTYLDPALETGQIAAGSLTDYWAGKGTGLMTMNTANPASISARTTVGASPVSPTIVRQHGSTTAVIDSAGQQLRIYDFTLTESQQLRASFALGGSAHAMELTRLNTTSPLLACVAVGGVGVRVIDITTPNAPALRSTIGVSPALMAANEARLYLMTGNAEMKIYTLVAPASPGLLSTTPYGGGGGEFACMTAWRNGGTLAVALGTRTLGLWLIDATSQNSPLVTSVHNPVTGYSVHAVAKGSSSMLYVSASEPDPDFDSFRLGRLETLNVASITNPTPAYVSAPGFGAGPQGPFDSLTFVSNSPNRFVLGVVEPFAGQSPDEGALTVFALGTSDVKLYSIFTERLHGVQPDIGVNTNGSRVVLAARDAGLYHLSPPQSWAAGFSSPAPGATVSRCRGETASLSVDALAQPFISTSYHSLGQVRCRPLEQRPDPVGVEHLRRHDRPPRHCESPPAGCRLLHLSGDELVRRAIFELHPPDPVPRRLQLLGRRHRPGHLRLPGRLFRGRPHSRAQRLRHVERPGHL